MDFLDSSTFENLFWLFFSISTSVLMLWSAIVFRHQRSIGSRCMLVGAALELPLSLFNSFYWYVWPYGFIEEADWGDDSAFGSETFLDQLETWTSHASSLFYVLWMVGLLFVAFRYRAEKQHARVQQNIAESTVGPGDGSTNGG